MGRQKKTYSDAHLSFNRVTLWTKLEAFAELGFGFKRPHKFWDKFEIVERNHDDHKYRILFRGLQAGA